MPLKRLLKAYALPLLAAVAATVAVQKLLVAQYALPAGLRGEELLPGDRVLVNRLAYARLPWRSEAGRQPKRGDVVAFGHPFAGVGGIGKGTACTERCTALPGDTVWVDPKRRRVLPARTTADARPVAVPGKGRPVEVTPWNARLLFNALRLHEACRVELRGDTAIWLDKRPLRRAYVTQDYYWVEGSESQYGLVPASLLIGRVFCVSYSVDPAQPFYRALRTGRFFLPIR